MATPPAPPETAQATQETLASLALPLLHAAWALLDLNNLDATVPRFREAVQAVVNKYGRASAALALQHFRAVRLDAGVPGRPEVPLIGDVPEGFIDQALAEAIAEAMSPLDTAEGQAALAEAEADIARATAFLDSQAEQLVLEQGRRQMLTAVAVDREAKGWARIPNAGACSFCLMLAVRAGSGLLYTSKRVANFRAHPNCRCVAEPVFGRFEPTAQVREAQRVWEDVTNGRSGHDARVAFRQAIEGREVTGAKVLRRAPSKSDNGSKGDTQRRTYKILRQGEGRTPENQRAQLRVLEAMPPAKTPEAAEYRRRRIAEIHKYLGE